MEREPLPDPTQVSARHKTLGRVGIGLALGLTATGLGTFWYGRYFLNERLSPLIEAELNKTLKRPVKLGQIDRVGLTSLRFGKSTVPATTEQANFLVAESIDLRLDLWSYVQARKLGIDVTVQNPQVYLKQDLSGQYFPIIEQPKQAEASPIDLRTVTVDNGQLTLQPTAQSPAGPAAPVTLNQLHLTSDWTITDPNNQRVRVSGGGKVVSPLLNPKQAGAPIPEELARAIAAQKVDVGALNMNADWDLSRGQGNVQLRSQNLLATSLQGFLTTLPFSPTGGRVDGNMGVTIRAGKPTPDIQGNFRVRDVSLHVPNVPQPISNVSGNVLLDGTTATLQDISAKYGPLLVRADGTIDTQTGFNIDASVDPIDIATALTSFKVKTAVPVKGELKATAKITGKKPQVTATLSGTKPIAVDRIVLKEVQAKIQTKDFTTIQFSQIGVKPAIGGRLQGEGQLRLPAGKTPASVLAALSLSGVTAEKVAEIYKTKLPVAVGEVPTAVTIDGGFDNLQILAQFDAPKALYPTSGEVLIANNVATVRNTIVKFPMGDVGVSGKIDLVGDRAWQAQLVSNGIPLSALAAKQRGSISGVVNLNSPTGSFKTEEITANADLDLPEGVAAIPDPINARLDWNGRSLLVPDVRVGNYLTANGKVNLAFNADRVPKGIDSVDLNLIARDVSIRRLRSFIPKLSSQATGAVNFNGKLAGPIDKLAIAGNLRVNGVEIDRVASSFLPSTGNPKPSLPSGAVAFTGNVSGSVNSPKLAGNLEVADLKFNRVAFDPQLSGPLSFDLKSGLAVELTGKHGSRDRIALRLDSRFQPIDFDIRLREATATGNRVEEAANRLHVVIKDFPVAIAATAVGQSNLDGKISSQLVVNLGQDLSATGSFDIDRPRYGRIQANQLKGNIAFSNGDTTITNGKLAIDPTADGKTSNGIYEFSLAFRPKAETPLQGQVAAKNGNVQDVFAILQWSQFSDIAQGFTLPENAKAAALQPLKTIGLIRQDGSADDLTANIAKATSPTLYGQLEYFSQLQTRIEQQKTVAAAANNNLPPLTEFNGQFDGKISFAASNRDGLGIAFELKGKKWEYGKFAVDDVATQGKFRNNILTLNTLRLQSGNSIGQIVDARLGLLEQSGKVELANFPIESLRPLPLFNDIPVDITGNVNGNATIGGNLFNPRASGQLTMADATINRQPIESAGGSFDYNNGRLKFNSKVNATGPEPLNISGDIPLKLPFSLVRASNAIALDIDVKNEGLAFINVLSQPVRWVDGQGFAKLVVSGTTRMPKVLGEVELSKAKLQIAGLPGDLTDVNGKMTFDRDHIDTNLTGRFSEGELSAKGVLAISDPNLIVEGHPDYNNPLILDAKQLKLDLKNLYAGLANGSLIVKGSALAPEVSGEIALSDGRVILADSDNSQQIKANSTESSLGNELKFNQLMVKLAQNIQVTRVPLFNMLAEGDISVNGTLSNLRPSGRINILRGQVNAISTRFRVDRSYDNYAEFVPAQGLNPNLNVRVIGAVPEVTRRPISDTPLDALNPRGVPVSNLGAQRTLQVQITVGGNANKPNIAVSSSPPRTESEILALIGGGLLQGGGGDAAAAFANLAGGTVITFLQDAIGDALNLSEFNLTPTTSNPVGGKASSLGFAAEAAVDIGRSFSVAVRGVINDPSQPTTYTLRYRLTPSTQVRTNTDLQGNNSTSVEFETRF